VCLAGGVAKLALIERHNGSGAVQVALVDGFGLTARCGIASSVAHDSHHILVIGTHEVDMALAVGRLAEVGGGQVVVKDGRVIGQIERAIAGLMSVERAEVVARKADTVLAGFKACGCRINNPNMTMSLLALVVIPEGRISAHGLVDVRHSSIIPVVAGKAD
jgi:adenine deaminase